MISKGINGEIHRGIFGGISEEESQEKSLDNIQDNHWEILSQIPGEISERIPGRILEQFIRGITG